MRYEEQEYCYDCQKIIHFYEQGRSLWLHKMPVSQSIYQFKYRNRRVFAQYYAEQMAGQFADLLRKWQIEVIIPVPIHKVSGETRIQSGRSFGKRAFRTVGGPMEAFAVRRVQKQMH